jgi:hypothetical protein
MSQCSTYCVVEAILPHADLRESHATLTADRLRYRDGEPLTHGRDEADVAGRIRVVVVEQNRAGERIERADPDDVRDVDQVDAVGVAVREWPVALAEPR